ncbi:probable glutathione S-transferase parC [Dendrobium catenatum]|uniref:probable glutathione S-transferase parC n=1 Tax=Dendrobium catenatum TaxID=906689 RepID=UPI00109FB10C|nr:probable glutathione S-transferase parC [Dendrobium catenatum]
MGNEEQVLLLSWRASVFGLRVQIALEEKGVAYTYREEDIFEKSKLLLESNPVYKKVPVLIHGDKVVRESLIILEYIDQVWDKHGPSLLPADPHRRAQTRFWADFISKKIYDSGRRIRHSKGIEKEEAKEEFMRHLKILEGELGEKLYFNGDSFGFLDIALITFSCWIHTYETFGGFSVKKECPKLMTWVRRCMERESVAKTLPSPLQVYQIACLVKKKLGFE